MFLNDIFMASAVGWFFSQMIKLASNLLKKRDKVFWNFVWASGFPSTHSALTTSTSIYILLKFGLSDPLFGLSLILTFIVIYDRLKINQVYRIIRSVYPDLDDKALEKGIHLNETFGHKIIEVAAGILIGVLSGFLTYWLYNPSPA